jgi:hypothetical protein
LKYVFFAAEGYVPQSPRLEFLEEEEEEKKLTSLEIFDPGHEKKNSNCHILRM